MSVELTAEERARRGYLPDFHTKTPSGLLRTTPEKYTTTERNHTMQTQILGTLADGTALTSDILKVDPKAAIREGTVLNAAGKDLLAMAQQAVASKPLPGGRWTTQALDSVTRSDYERLTAADFAAMSAEQSDYLLARFVSDKMINA